MLRTRTSTSLLEGLLDPSNDQAWRRWIDRYRPLIVRFARGLGVPHDDCEDVAQSTLLAFVEAYRAHRYDRASGRLSSWLFGIAQNTVRKAHRTRVVHQSTDDPQSRASVDASLGADPQLIWEAEWRNEVFAATLEEVKNQVEATTWDCFQRFALDGRAATDVATELGVTENAVFGAKRRVLERARAILPLMETLW